MEEAVASHLQSAAPQEQNWNNRKNAKTPSVVIGIQRIVAHRRRLEARENDRGCGLRRLGEMIVAEIPWRRSLFSPRAV
jgi:hypothetical protein